LESDFDIGITEKEAAEAHTAEDIVNLVWNKVRRRATLKLLGAVQRVMFITLTKLVTVHLPDFTARCH
jgi:hypothetical protein